MLSLCPSTTTLNPEPPSASSAESDDDESLEIVQMDTVPQLPDCEARGRPKYRESEGKKRHLSLSPLRTLLPFSSRERKISSHSNSGPYFRSTPFLRSTASLKTGPNLNPSILRLPLSSPTTPTRHDFMSIFRKDRTHSDDDDSLHSWELLPVNLLTAAEAVTNTSSNSSSLTSSPTRPAFEEEPVVRPREKKIGIFPRRNNRHAPPQPSVNHEEVVGQPANPPTVFTSPLSTEQPWNAESVLSPVREGTSMFERALQTPLPQTPIEPTVNRPRELSPIITSSLVRCQHVSPLNQDVTPSPSNSPAQSRHHYHGRPLPRTPSSNRPIVDSTYGTVESINMSTTRACPEGLLIDFDGPVVHVEFDSSSYKPSDVSLL